MFSWITGPNLWLDWLPRVAWVTLVEYRSGNTVTMRSNRLICRIQNQKKMRLRISTFGINSIWVLDRSIMERSPMLSNKANRLLEALEWENPSSIFSNRSLSGIKKCVLVNIFTSLPKQNANNRPCRLIANLAEIKRISPKEKHFNRRLQFKKGESIFNTLSLHCSLAIRRRVSQFHRSGILPDRSDAKDAVSWVSISQNSNFGT